MKNYANKTITIIGGTGYVGHCLASKAVSLGITVYSVSRSGQPVHDKPIRNIKYIQGNALQPSTYLDALEVSDAIVHAVGILIDTVITSSGKRQPGDQGSYESIHRDTAIAIGDALDRMQLNKKIVYLSASKHLPISRRYLSTKIEAENYLRELRHCTVTVLKPGFIYSKKKWVTIPLSFVVDTYAHLYKKINHVLPDGILKACSKRLAVDFSVRLDQVVTAALVACFDTRLDGKYLYNDDMVRIAKS